MDRHDILKVLEIGKSDDIKALMGNVKVDQVLKAVKPEIVKSKQGILNIIRLLFQATKGIEETLQEQRFSVYQFLLNLLKQNLIPMSFVSELVALLLTETDTLLTAPLCVLVKGFTETLEKGEDLTNKWIEIYPRVLSTLGLRENVEVDGNTYTGVGFRAHAIDSLITLRWRIYAVPHIVSLFIDLKLTMDECLKVINKCFDMLKELDIMDSPVLFLHLLRIAEQGHREVVLEGLIRFYNDKNKEIIKSSEASSMDDVGNLEDSPERLLEAEGNAILHVSMAIERDGEALKDLLKVLNANKLNQEMVLSPFCLALCLSKKTNSSTDHVPMIEFLKTTIFKCFEENNRSKKSSWLRSMVKKDFDLANNFMITIKNSKHGWDFILENLVELGLNLIEIYGSKSRVLRCDEIGNCSSADRACILGQDILLETYKIHNYIISTVLESIMNLLWTRPFPAVLNIIDLIDLFVIAKPRPLITSCLNTLKQFLEHLPFLEPQAAFALLNSLMPLLKKSLGLKDTLMIVLRKSMLFKNLNARKVSTLGYLLVLKQFKVLGTIPFSQSQESDSCDSISQAVVEFHQNKSNTSANEGLCLELLGVMQHSLDRQSDNKQIVYECINDVLMKNPNLGTSIVELLLGQFNKYYNWNENANPPISLSACVEIKIDNPVLIEPIGHLINAICICIVSFPTLPTNDDEPEGPASVAKLESGMKSLVKRIIASDLEDFEMDKSSDFGNNTSVGQKNQYLASQLLGIIEALMDWIFKTGNSSLESCKNFISLFEIHQKVMKIVIEKSTAWSGKPKGKKRKDAADETAASTSQVEVPIQKETGKTKPKNMFYSRKSLLSLDMICKLFYSTFYEADNNESESSAMLRGNESLHRYCLETVEQIVANLESYTKSEALCETLATIAKCMMKIYNCDFDESESTQRRKGRYLRTLSLFCIELLVKITKFFCNLSDNSFLHKFIFHLKSKSIQSQECNDTTSSVAYVRYSSSLVKTFEKNVIRRLSEDIEELTPAEKNSFYKEVTQMLNFIQLLVCRMECYAIISEGNEKQNLCSPAFNWAKQMCIQQKIDDVQTCVAFMNLYLELSHQQKFVNDDYPYSEVALGLRITMGNIDNDKTVEGVNKYGVINEKSAVNILNLLIQHLERILSDIVWILDAIKSGGFGVDSSKTENKICKQLGIVIFSAHHIIQIAIRTNIDTVSKFMIKIYNVLINFTKHNLSFYSRKFKNVPKICNNFEKLVKLCGSHLNPPVLEFISYVEEKIDTTPTKKPRTTIAEKNKVLKETKQIPNLSYAQEQFYHFLLSLGKKAKIDFSSHIKSGAARDFRINLIQVQEALNAEEDDNESIDEPPAKRKNVASSSKPITSPAKQSTPITQNKTTQNDSSPKPGKGPSQNSARKGKSRLGRSK